MGKQERWKKELADKLAARVRERMDRFVGRRTTRVLTAALEFIREHGLELR